MSDHASDIVAAMRRGLSGRMITGFINMENEEMAFPFRDGRFEFYVVGYDALHAAKVTVEGVHPEAALTETIEE